MAQTPSAAKQLFGGHVPPRYGELERRPGAPRQIHELGKLHVLQPIGNAVIVHRLQGLPAHDTGEGRIGRGRRAGEQLQDDGIKDRTPLLSGGRRRGSPVWDVQSDGKVVIVLHELPAFGHCPFHEHLGEGRLPVHPDAKPGEAGFLGPFTLAHEVDKHVARPEDGFDRIAAQAMIGAIGVHIAPIIFQAEPRERRAPGLYSGRRVVASIPGARIDAGAFPTALFDEVDFMAETPESEQPLEHPGLVTADRHADDVGGEYYPGHAASGSWRGFTYLFRLRD